MIRTLADAVRSFDRQNFDLDRARMVCGLRWHIFRPRPRVYLWPTEPTPQASRLHQHHTAGRRAPSPHTAMFALRFVR